MEGHGCSKYLAECRDFCSNKYDQKTARKAIELFHSSAIRAGEQRSGALFTLYSFELCIGDYPKVGLGDGGHEAQFHILVILQRDSTWRVMCLDL